MNLPQFQIGFKVRAMADRTDKNPLNVPGNYCNDLACIDCDLCREIAPQTFTCDDDEGLSHVWKQPVTAEEITAAEEARKGCPSQTIGDDG